MMVLVEMAALIIAVAAAAAAGVTAKVFWKHESTQRRSGAGRAFARGLNAALASLFIAGSATAAYWAAVVIGIMPEPPELMLILLAVTTAAAAGQAIAAGVLMLQARLLSVPLHVAGDWSLWTIYWYPDGTARGVRILRAVRRLRMGRT